MISQYQPAYYQSGNETCATLHEGIARVFVFLWDHATHDNVSAVATVIIAIFTLTLWRATDRLWGAGERQLTHLKDSAERQLGAYVGVSEGKIISHDMGNTFVAEISIKNSGQTPAYKVTHSISTELRDRLQRPKEPFAESPKLPQEWVLMPGFSWMLVKNIAVGGPSGAGAISKQKDIFVWGRVDYEDVFDKPQWLSFRFVTSERAIRQHDGTVMRTIGWELDPCGEGNAST